MKGARSRRYAGYRYRVSIATRINAPQGWGTVDHIVPVSFGFKHDIPPHLIGGADNLCRMSLNDNIQKGTKITAEAIDILRGWGYNDLADAYENR